jgi:ABC-type transporter MlaC component
VPAPTATPVLLLVAILALPSVAGAAAGPVPQTDPVATVREAERQVRAVFTAGGGRAGLERVSASAVDWEELTRRSSGPRWPSFSPADRAAVTKGLRALVEETYLARLVRPDPLFALAVVGNAANGPESRVTVVVQSGASQGRIELRLLRGKDRRYRIFDATVNGVAVLAGYQERFAQLLDAGGLPRLLESLEAQRKALVRMRSGNP